MLEIALVVAASALMMARPFGLPSWTGPGVCAAVVLATRGVSPTAAWGSLAAMRSPLLFLVFAVPLAVTLDDLGLFATVAARFDGGRHLASWLWWLAAAVVVVFNLDAAVVLLTPLYIRIGRRHGLPIEALAFQPALLACLASGVLPVSNLTNLIVAERWGLGVGDFLRQLALPSLAATAAGFIAYRAVFRIRATGDRCDDAVDDGALVRCLPIVVLVVVGFMLGDTVGVPAWLVAAAATVWSAALAGRLRWRVVPVEAVLTVGALAVLVTAALPHLDLARLYGTGGFRGDAGVVASTVLTSNVANNLPAVLAGSASITHSSQAWLLLIAANVGAVFTVSASLSTMLWRDTAKRAGVHVSARRWSSVAVRVGVPALAAAVAVSLAVS